MTFKIFKENPDYQIKLFKGKFTTSYTFTLYTTYGSVSRHFHSLLSGYTWMENKKME